jgi:arylsulfatase A-like enzyme
MSEPRRDPVDALCLLAGAELLLVRISGGPLAWTDLLAAALAWAALLAWAASARAPAHLDKLVTLLICATIALPPTVHRGAGPVAALVGVAVLGIAVWWWRGPRLGLPAVLVGTTLVGMEHAGLPTDRMGVWVVLTLALAAAPRAVPLLAALALLPTPKLSQRAGDDLLLVTIDTWRSDEPLPSLAPLPLHTTVWTPAPWTLPALASLWTSAPPWQHGAVRGEGGFVPLKNPDTLPAALRDAGYRTVALSGGNAFTGQPYGLMHGFNHIVHPWSGSPYPIPRARNPFGKPRPLFSRWFHLPQRPDGPALLRRAADELATPGADFVWVHLMDLHLPIAEAPCRPAVLSTPGARTPLTTDPFWSSEAGRLCWTAARQHALRRLDEAVAELLAAIDLQHTLVVFTSDHGESLGEAGLEHGHTLHPVLTEVPLVIGGPGTPPAPTAPIDLLDLGATLRALAGLPIPRLPTGGLPTGSLGRDLREPLAPRPITFGAPLYLDDARGVLHEGWLLRVEQGARTLTPLDPTTDDAPPQDLDALLPPPAVAPTDRAVTRDVEALRALGYLP